MRTRALIFITICVPLIGFAQDSRQGMQPRVLSGDDFHCRSLWVRDGHLMTQEVCSPARKAEVAWDGHVATLTNFDAKASTEWMRAHSLLPRLSVRHHDLYWDGKKVNLGEVDVFNLYEAIPWEGGVMIYGRTVPRRHSWESWPFKGHFIETRDIEPFCAIYFDPKTMKGEDRWLNGVAYLGFFVFPLPD